MRTSCPTCTCPDSRRPDTLNPDPWPTWYCTLSKNQAEQPQLPLKMSATQHLNGLSTGRGGGRNWSEGVPWDHSSTHSDTWWHKLAHEAKTHNSDHVAQKYTPKHLKLSFQKLYMYHGLRWYRTYIPILLSRVEPEYQEVSSGRVGVVTRLAPVSPEQGT